MSARAASEADGRSAGAGSLAALLAILALGGCGEDRGMDDAEASPTPGTAARTTAQPEREDPQSRLEPPSCPPDSAGCRRVTGTILVVQRHDPDGDGDAHFVLLSREAITGPGISVVDVRPDLRPDPLPEPGDQLAAAGPVFPGSLGQMQVQAERITATAKR